MVQPILNRRSIRLAQPIYVGGSFFVTICTRDRARILGSVMQGMVALSPVGCLVREEWLRTPVIRLGVTLGEWVIMPDHVHGIVHLPHADWAGALPEDRPGYLKRSLSSLIGGFKSACTRRYIRLSHGTPGSMWQRNYYERVIRDQEELDLIAAYIISNPIRWATRPA